MDYFTKRYHPPGTEPGTLAPAEIQPRKPPVITLLDYMGDKFTERPDTTLEECRKYLSRPSITWIDIHGSVDAATLAHIGELFQLHPLALEDVINSGQRPKVDAFGDQLFIVMNLPFMTDGRLKTEQISLFFGKNFVISVHEDLDNPFELVRHRLRNGAGHFRDRKADYLLYTLLDAIVDQGFPVLEALGEDLEQLEERLLENPSHQTLTEIHVMRRELMLLRRMLWPQREVVNALTRNDLSLIRSETMPYLKDCYDHTVQIMDLLETFREVTASLLDVYLSSVSFRLNDVMRVLTVIATIFIPLTFIAGVYGMNFASESASPWAMPELRWEYGYPAVWLVMITVAAGLLVFFRRKRWI